jgi:predicted DNA repair protein MutK
MSDNLAHLQADQKNGGSRPYVRAMATGFFALLDDIALLMDDVAVVTKVAGKKTAGILGDDLAVNAEKAVGFKASRELPVLWAITKGSFLNKLIILPLAFLLSAFAAWLIEPILVLGGIYLSYEGVEKVVHHIGPHRPTQHKGGAVQVDEKVRIRSAVLVDFILSVEIIILALSSASDAALPVQIVSVSIIAMVATVGVYGLVGLIVRMDDAGLVLMKSTSSGVQRLGRAMVQGLPLLIRIIGAVGTAALILVAGGIFHHHLPHVHHWVEALPGLVADTLLGFVGGTLTFGCVAMFGAIRKRIS